uniref:Uncharacterized protein n=1 Tax=Siphoviridae sp. ctWBz6 TaxID=2825536 RepID=A0A8S5QH59_9CAUD|nr:MAG TPA: hypothetical protein [Siphoviridae sp. ctWBz6]
MLRGRRPHGLPVPARHGAVRLDHRTRGFISVFHQPCPPPDAAAFTSAKALGARIPQPRYASARRYT